MEYDGPGFAPAFAEKRLMAGGLLAAQIPKIHLHCHLEGTLRGATFVELAGKYGFPLRYRPGSAGGSGRDDGQPLTDPKRPYRFADHQEFLYLFAAVSRTLKKPEDYERLAREFVEDALREGVVYGELFISPPVWTFFHPQLDVRETIEAIVAQLRAARPRATFKLLPDLTRNFGAEKAMATARAVAEMTDLDVIGVSLGGDELRFPASLFVEPFAYARAQGLHRVAHAGESDGAASVRDAVELLHAQRVGHGVHALEDPAVVELLADRRVALEVCPTSNRLTGVDLEGHPHPYVDLDRHGCLVTIDADDPALFETSITREYEIVEKTAGAQGLERYVRNAAVASFAPPAEKKTMLAQIEAAVAELRGQPRS